MARQLRRLAHRLDPISRPTVESEIPYDELMARLEKIVQEEELYLDPTISREALSSRLGTNRTYLSRAIQLRGETFSGFLNGFRLKHAMELMRNYPSMDHSEIAERSGFINQRSLNYLILKKYGYTLVAFRRRISQLLSRLPEGQILQPCHKGELPCLPQR